MNTLQGLQERYALQHDQLDALVDADRDRQLAVRGLEIYYHERLTSGPRFSGSLFDTFKGGGYRPEVANEFTSDDFVALGLLSMKPQVGIISVAYAVDTRLQANAEYLLGRVPADVPLHAATHSQINRSSPADKLWNLIRGVENVGPVTAFKLLGRKRPHLLPIGDSEIKKYMGIERGDSVWECMWAWFQDPQHVAAVRSLRHEAGLEQQGVGLLRTVDVGMWMIQKGYIPSA
ncbi:MAG TPA: DUF6308 family protein [Candidatus Saccharimonadales bacterium]|nr:DUF6308 family protein [Candidatus Saccharimonadales bacterium]